MFLVTQLIGLAFINSYAPRQSSILNQTTGIYENQTTQNQLPYELQPPEDAAWWAIIPSFVIAIILIFILMKFRVIFFLKLWFFVVIAIALGITFSSILNYFNLSPYYALILAIPLAFIKIYKRNVFVHNITELLIYPGLAAVFVPILGIWSALLFLVLISVYDMWAVWHSGIMQKMAKFQINHLKIFSGFFIPYFAKNDKQKIQLLKDKYKNKIPSKFLKKINLAILGGGDVVFPLILAGVVHRTLGLPQALLITLFATLSLLLLFVFARKGKFYPAMPFITSGCLVGLLFAWLI